MGQWVTRGDFGELFSTFEHTAWRLEVQPRYNVESERDSLASFAAGQPIRPVDVPEYRQWLDYVRAQTAAGRRIGRVRVQSDPPTEYQRWERWAGQWNTDAGEEIRYMTPQRAVDVGLPLDHDWWLFDSRTVFRMAFDDDLLLLGGHLITDPAIVVDHCAWRDLAVHYSAPDTGAPATT